jgi:N-methylhydantoinase A
LQKYSSTNVIAATNGDPVVGERDVVFDGVRHATPIVARDRLGLEYSATGPLIIEEQSATTVVPPNWSVTIDQQGSIVMQQRGL